MELTVEPHDDWTRPVLTGDLLPADAAPDRDRTAFETPLDTADKTGSFRTLREKRTPRFTGR